VKWWRNELARFGDRLTWLDEGETSRAYEFAMRFSSKSRYGLEPDAVRNIERLDVDDPSVDSNTWLIERIGMDSVTVILSRQEICRMEGSFFAAEWRDMLCPSRDDAIILCEGSAGILFYCHEDEFEFGLRSDA
jgi:hypothetical protein